MEKTSKYVLRSISVKSINSTAFNCCARRLKKTSAPLEPSLKSNLSHTAFACKTRIVATSCAPINSNSLNSMQFYQHGSFLSGGSIALLLAAIVPAQESALIADNQTGYILHNRSIDHRLQIGSLATIATAAVTLDWIYVNRITPSIPAVVPNSSVFNSILRPGDKIS